MSVMNTFPGPRIEISPKNSKRINKQLQVKNGGHVNNFETKGQGKTLALSCFRLEGFSSILAQ